MSQRLSIAIALCILTCLSLQPGPLFARQAKNDQKQTAAIKDQAQKVWQAYATLDASKARPFYASGAEHVFYDITPLQYHGIDEYQTGAAELLKTFRTADFRVNDDFTVHFCDGKQAWTTSTVNLDMIHADGNKTNMVARWTAIWEQQNGNWLIVHEHVSVPLGTQPEREQNIKPNQR